MLERGIFVISIDHEFGWGYADREITPEDAARIEKETDIIERLISLFEQYNIPVTWAVVGHLIDRGVPWDGNEVHPEYLRPIHNGEKRDWFYYHPPKHQYTNTLWFDTHNLVSKIRSSSANHDIASHGYAHILYDEQTTHQKNIEADLKNIGRVHRVHDVPLSTFIFPRNREGYHKLLKLNGFTTFRGNSKKWYDGFTGAIGRLARLIDYVLPAGRTVLPRRHQSGLIDIPDSMLFLGRNGLRKLVGGHLKTKAKRGIKKAVKKQEIFHLWFHPSNFSYSTEKQFRTFEAILKEAVKLREQGRLEIMTMEDITNNKVRQQ